MANLFVHFTVKPGAEPAFEEFCRGIYDASHAAEPDLVRYEYWRGATERTYYALLSFPDYRAFLHHQASPHHERLAGGFRDLCESARFEWIDPVPGAAPLAATRMQEPAEGANELERMYAQRMPAEVQPWWVALSGD